MFGAGVNAVVELRQRRRVRALLEAVLAVGLFRLDELSALSWAANL